MSQRNAWDREYHDEVQGDEEEKDVQRRKQQLSTRQEDDGGPERQHDGAPTQGRTVTEQKKIENLIAMQRREEGMQTNRSRSSSRRDRRKRIEKAMRDGKLMHTSSLEGIEEADASMELMSQRPFERIGPDSTSMDGPVTHAAPCVVRSLCAAATPGNRNTFRKTRRKSSVAVLQETPTA